MGPKIVQLDVGPDQARACDVTEDINQDETALPLLAGKESEIDLLPAMNLDLSHEVVEQFNTCPSC
eukprot:1653458-Amphidinium_carterae.1